MNNKQKKSRKELMSNIYGICSAITLLFIMAQVFLARHTMVQANEWEKAKVTIENFDRFKENLKETALYGNTFALNQADFLWPDFTTTKGYDATENLRNLYHSYFEDGNKTRQDIEKSLSIFDAFAYPIIMGYANELGSYEMVSLEFNTYTNFYMPMFFRGFPKLGKHIKLLHRLWRVRHEQTIFQHIDHNNDSFIKVLNENINNLLCFEGTEVTPASLKQYEKKLEKELKKIQKEIKVFRKNNSK
jgi:hypothetical protein